MTTAPPGGPDDEPTPRSDAEVEAVLTHRTGQRVPPHLEQDVLAVDHLRQCLLTVAPAPSAELALLLREGSRRPPRTPRLTRATGWFVGLGMGAQVGLASAAAAAGLVAGGSAHVLPGPAQDAYDSFVSILQPEDDDRGRGLPGEVGTGAGTESGPSTTDLAPNERRRALEPDGEHTSAQDDGAEGSTPGRVPSDGGAGAGARSAGGSPAPGPAGGGTPGAGASGPGGTHSQTDDQDVEDEAEEAGDEAADAAEDAADEAADAQDEAEDAAEETQDAAEDDEDDGADGADDEREEDGDRGPSGR